MIASMCAGPRRDVALTLIDAYEGRVVPPATALTARGAWHQRNVSDAPRKLQARPVGCPSGAKPPTEGSSMPTVEIPHEYLGRFQVEAEATLRFAADQLAELAAV